MPPRDRRTSRQRSSRDPVASELGAAQAEIMNVIWAKGGATVPEIHAAINETRKTDAAYTTVLTFVQRLSARGLWNASPKAERSGTRQLRAATNSLQLVRRDD